MGVELVKTVSALHGDLSGRAFKVLVRMALVSLDRPNDAGRPARLYFGGWEPLAQSLGWVVPPDADDPEVRRRRKKLAGYVSDALTELDRAGLIQRTGGKARTNNRQSYLLTLASVPQEVGGTSTPELGVQSTPELGVQSTPELGVHVYPKNWDLSTPELGVPRKDSGGTEDLLQDPTPTAPASPQGVARARPRPRHSSPAACRHGINGGMRTTGTGANASRHCVECEVELPAVEALAFLDGDEVAS